MVNAVSAVSCKLSCAVTLDYWGYFASQLTTFLCHAQLGLRRLVAGEKDFCQVFQPDDQTDAKEQIVARANKYSKRLVERADKELDMLPFPSWVLTVLHITVLQGPWFSINQLKSKGSSDSFVLASAFVLQLV
jgi:hypothetical protein